jgi:alkylhydroperoxidase/carboxymuconolactone decarboxylase family protein YurZ
MKRTKSGSKRWPLTERQIASGDWNPFWDTMRNLDPAFLEGYLAFRSVPHSRGVLDPKVRELILIAANASTTHLFAPGIRRHIQNAFELGATKEQILEAIQLVTVLGIHACNVAVPILIEEASKIEDAKISRTTTKSAARRRR